MTTNTSLRDLFLLEPDITFLNHGSFGACPKPVSEKCQYWQRELERQPVIFQTQTVYEKLFEARTTLGAYIGCDPDDVVFMTNPSTGINTVIKSLNLEAGDEILASDHEYGAMVRAWQMMTEQSGAQFVHREIPLPVTTPEAFIEHFWSGVTDQTRVIFLSHITSSTALIFPVAEIIRRARERGILTIIDGAHVPGQLPLNLHKLDPDVYVGSCNKWLCGPKGTSFLYVRKSLQPEIKPLVVSWGKYGNDPSTSPFVLDQQWAGTRDMSGFLAIPEAIQLVQTPEWQTEQARCRELVRTTRAQLLDHLQTEPLCPADGNWLGQMAAVKLPHQVQDARTFKQALWDEFRIEVPIIQRHDEILLRFSLQVYNTEEDADRLVDAVQTLVQRIKSRPIKRQ